MVVDRSPHMERFQFFAICFLPPRIVARAISQVKVHAVFHPSIQPFIYPSIFSVYPSPPVDVVYTGV